MTIQTIKSTTLRGELRSTLKSHTLKERYTLLKGAIEELNAEVESELGLMNTDVAIFKMGQVVMFEDELMIVERLLMKEAVRV